MKKATKTKVHDSVKARPDCDRRIRQADRLARVLRLLGLIQSGKIYDVNALANELKCSARTVARDLKTLEYAGVPWYFDKESSSYRLPQKYRFPIPLQHISSDVINGHLRPHKPSSYADYFTAAEPMSTNEIHFVARWLHEHHNFSHCKNASAVGWNPAWELPAVALANFYTVFMNAFKTDTAAFVELVIQYRVTEIEVPWKSEAKFRQRDAVICHWIKDHGIGTVVNINDQIKKHRSSSP